MNRDNQVNATLLEMLLVPDYGKHIQQKESIEIYSSCASICKIRINVCTGSQPGPFLSLVGAGR